MNCKNCLGNYLGYCKFDCLSDDKCENFQDRSLWEKLPCRLGETVYSIFGGEIIERTVGRVIVNGYTTPRIWVDLDCPFLSTVIERWDLGIGKDFFLSREEAEKALKEREKNG